MEKETYVVTDTITKFQYSTPQIQDILLNTQPSGEAIRKTSIDVQIKMSEVPNIYLVILTVCIEAILQDSERPVFTLEIEKEALVQITEEDVTENELRNILSVIVPQNMYDSLGVVIGSFIQQTGFPPFELDAFSFKEKKHPQKTDKHYS